MSLDGAAGVCAATVTSRCMLRHCRLLKIIAVEAAASAPSRAGGALPWSEAECRPHLRRRRYIISVHFSGGIARRRRRRYDDA